jgi:septal ring factor EnvC (AmiA/AmiB activator)
MRPTLLSTLAWLGALQAFSGWGVPAWSLDTAARLIGIAGVLGTLTVLVYRLGVWRQEFENTKDRVAAEVKKHREESTTNFDRVERRLEAIDHLLAMLSDQLSRANRRQSQTNRRLSRLEGDRSPYADDVS